MRILRAFSLFDPITTTNDNGLRYRISTMTCPFFRLPACADRLGTGTTLRSQRPAQTWIQVHSAQMV
jgi:hypothetical protein